ncbi:MAG: hypothetical protein K0S72_2230, partial [Arthrobacter sp.]|nr:hypothetical protein [Arthrobacter sp.]
VRAELVDETASLPLMETAPADVPSHRLPER